MVFILGSAEPRSPREKHIKYRIGQVVKHKKWGYRGVIIGWDKDAKVVVFLTRIHFYFHLFLNSAANLLDDFTKLTHFNSSVTIGHTNPSTIIFPDFVIECLKYFFYNIVIFIK